MEQLTSFESRLVRLGGALLSPGGRRGALIVLIYHRVLPVRDALLPSEPDAAQFAAQMELVAGHFRVLPLSEAAQRLASGSLPPRAAAITFDDGYANNCTVALPILRARGIPASVFVAPGFLNGGRMFNDTVIEAIRMAPERLDLRAEGFSEYHLTDAAARIRVYEQIIGALKYLAPDERQARAEQVARRSGARLPNDLMMTDAQVLQLHRAGIEIGAHTVHHPILTRVDTEAARRDILNSKTQLEEITGNSVKAFAYPNGQPRRDYDGRHVRIVAEAGFELALSTAWGASTIDSDRFQIPRIAPWDASPLRYAARMVRAYRTRRFDTA